MAKRPPRNPDRAVRKDCKYLPEFCERLINHGASGYSYVSFAATVSVTHETLKNWEKSFPEFKEAKELGKLKCLFFWENLAIENITRSSKDFNAALWIFNMKNRFKEYGWTDQKELIAPTGIEIKQTTTIAELYSMEAARRAREKELLEKANEPQ